MYVLHFDNRKNTCCVEQNNTSSVVPTCELINRDELTDGLRVVKLPTSQIDRLGISAHAPRNAQHNNTAQQQL